MNIAQQKGRRFTPAGFSLVFAPHGGAQMVWLSFLNVKRNNTHWLRLPFRLAPTAQQRVPMAKGSWFTPMWLSGR